MERVTRLCFACSIVFLAGCASPASFSAWQRGVEQYVQEQGNGDPGVLRDMTLPDGRRGFNVIGGDHPKGSTDANALLLGHRTIHGKGHFIYLVGLVKDERLDDLRLAAVAFEPTGQARWSWGKSDSQALETYRSHRESSWKQRFPGRTEAPQSYMSYPGPEDVFELDVQAASVLARHPASGAGWQLTLVNQDR